MPILRKRPFGIERLRRVPAFRGCTRKELATIDRLTYETTFPAGAKLCVQGEAGQQVFMILEGEVEVRAGATVIAGIGAGDVCGEIAVLDHLPRVATVTALTPVTVLVMSEAEFMQLLYAAPLIARQMMVTMAQRLRSIDSLLYA